MRNRWANMAGTLAMTLGMTLIAPSSANARAGDIALRGISSFHVGGREVTIAGQPVMEVARVPGGPLTKIDPNGVYLVEQMYAQYFLPQQKRGAVPRVR